MQVGSKVMSDHTHERTDPKIRSNLLFGFVALSNLYRIMSKEAQSKMLIVFFSCIEYEQLLVFLNV